MTAPVGKCCDCACFFFPCGVDESLPIPVKKMRSGQSFLSAVRRITGVLVGVYLGGLIGINVAHYVSFPGTTRGNRFKHDWMHKAANEELKRRNERRTTTNSNAAAAADG